MNINSTQSATSNNFYPNPTSKQTLKMIEGVTAEYESQTLLFTDERLKLAAQSVTNQVARRTTAPDYEHVNRKKIEKDSTNKKIDEIRKRLDSNDTPHLQTLTKRVKVR